MPEKAVLLDSRHAGGFVKAYHEVLYADITDGAFRTYLILLRYVTLPDRNGVPKMYAYVGQDRVAAERGLHEKTVRDHIRELEEAGLVHTERRPNKSNLTRMLRPPEIPLPWKKNGPDEITRSGDEIRTGRNHPVRPHEITPPDHTKSPADLERGTEKEEERKSRVAGATTPRPDIEGSLTEMKSSTSYEEEPVGRGPRPKVRRGPTDSALEAEKQLPPGLVQRLRKLAQSTGARLSKGYSMWVCDIISKFEVSQILGGVTSTEEAAAKGEYPTLRLWNIEGRIKHSGATGQSGRADFGTGVTVTRAGANPTEEYVDHPVERARYYWKCGGCGYDRIVGDDTKCERCSGRIVWPGQ